MEKIESIDLLEEALIVEADLMAAKRAALRASIAGIHRDVNNWLLQLDTHRKKAKELEDKIAKALERLGRIRNGDWNAVPSSMEERKAPAGEPTAVKEGGDK